MVINNANYFEILNKTKAHGVSVKTHNQSFGQLQPNEQNNKSNLLMKDKLDTLAHKAKDEILPNDSMTKLKVNIEQASKLPRYAINGLKGDTNANFFEFLQLGNIPYLIGGPILIWCFKTGEKAAGQALRAAKDATKKAVVGVGLYYAAAVLAQAAINKPVKWFRGIDLNHPYKDVVAMKATTPDGVSPQKIEYHNVYESMDFTRWDLLYRNDPQAIINNRLVNENYDKIAEKMGINNNLNDADSTTKPLIRSIVASSRAWKSFLIIPLAAVAAGLSSQEAWEKFGIGMKNDFKKALSKNVGVTFMEDMIKRAGKTGIAFAEHFVEPLKSSFKDLWTGADVPVERVISKHLGKAAIITAVGSIIIANINILRNSTAKDKKIIDLTKYPSIQKLGNGTYLSSLFKSSSNQENK